AFHLLSFVAALLCKESVVTLPLITFVLALFHKARFPDVKLQRDLMPSTISFFLLIPYLAIRKKILGSVISGYGSGTHLGSVAGTIKSLLLQMYRCFMPAFEKNADLIACMLLFAAALFVALGIFRFACL